MPKILSETDIADFRAGLVRVATRRFARYGYDGVSMRQLADDLGCSPKTPYRYFADKDEILAAVRAAAFARFADALEAAAARESGPVPRSLAVADAYVGFAERNPDAYRLMFDLRHAHTDYPDLDREAARARRFVTSQAEDLLAAGLIQGDPGTVGFAMWAGLHGLVLLKLAGFMDDGGPTFETVRHAMMSMMVRGARPEPAGAARSSGGRT